MDILYISQYYPPETPAPAARASELGRLWAAIGHNVTVLTGFPNHPTGKIPAAYRGKLWRLFMRDDSHGVKVHRTWLMPLPNRKSWERMLNYCSFFVSAVLRGAFLPRPQVVIATSPQLLVGLSGLIVAKLKRVPFVFEVRDLWPESLEAVGVSGKRSLLVKVLARVAGLLYMKAAHIVVVTAPFKEHLERKWGVSPEKISVVPNGVDQNFFSPQKYDEATSREFGLEGKFVVGYIGTIGNAHGVETLVEVASRLEEIDPRVFFLVVGEGAEKANLERLVAEKKLTNLRTFAAQSRSRIPALVAASDICLVLLKKSELFKTVIPTKMLEFMSCGRPIVAAVAGECARILEKADAGICVPPENAEAIVSAIRSLLADESARQRFGSNGRKYIVSEITREATANAYLSVIEKLLPPKAMEVGTAAERKSESAKASG